MANTEHRYTLQQDRKGMVWDLMLYVPTVGMLFGIGAKMWYSTSQDWSYLLFFMGSYFLFVGANRVLKTRLMVLPSAPIALELAKERVRVSLRGGSSADLVKNVKFFSEIGGKTFAVTGLDLSGKQQQHIFHVGQFADVSAYNDAKSRLAIYR